MKKIKRKFTLFILIMLFLIPCSTPLGIDAGDNTQKENDFLSSAEGDEPDDIIETFYESLDDDVLTYPDSDLFGTETATAYVNLDGGSGAGTLRDNTLTETETSTTTDYTITDGDSPPPPTPGNSYMMVYNHWDAGGTDDNTMSTTFTFEFGDTQHGYATLNFIFTVTGDSNSPVATTENGLLSTTESIEVSIYNTDTTIWDVISTPTPAMPNIITYVFEIEDYIDSVSCELKVKLHSHTTWTHPYMLHWVYYLAIIDSNPDTGYSQSFLNVTDVYTSGDPITTDGDIGALTCSDDAGWDVYGFNEPDGSQEWKGYYYEVRARANDTGNPHLMAVTKTADDYGGDTLDTAYIVHNTLADTGWHTYRALIDNEGTDGLVGSVSLLCKSATANVRWDIDYFRIVRINETGWQHDGSTVDGVTALTGGSVSSDSDELSLIADADGSTFEIVIDDTTTAAVIDTAYYPMFELSFNSGDSSDYIMVESYDGISWASVIANQTIGTDTLHANIKAVDSYIEKFRLSVNPSATVRMNWCKSNGFVNYTFSDSGTGSNDYIYVSSGAFYSSIDDGYIELNLDYSISVASASYQVYNLSTGSTAPEFSQYVSSWTDYSDDTRGATSTGTVIDLKLKFDGTEDISAIKFWEDSTAPTISEKYANPPDPYDDESLTFTVVASDSWDMYTVTLNAVEYPTGFSDVDYIMDESVDNTVYKYTFASLIDGDYIFSITASDGANTAIGYYPITIRESEIAIQEITLLGAGQDFTMVTFSARINKDCTYTIYEESASNPENDMWSGSVSAPSFNLAWDKMDTTDTNVNFTIVFTNGTLTENYTSQYQVAQTTFYTEWVAQTESYSLVSLTGYITKTCAYTLYLGDTYVGSGSITSKDFKLSFTKTLHDGLDHDFAVLFSNGTQTAWYNSSYYAWQYDPDAVEPGSPDWGKPDRQTIEFWTFIGVLLGGLAVIMIFVSHFTRGNT